MLTPYHSCRVPQGSAVSCCDPQRRLHIVVGFHVAVLSMTYCNISAYTFMSKCIVSPRKLNGKGDKQVPFVSTKH